MAANSGSGGSNGPDSPGELPQHPLVERLKPDPAQPPQRVTVLTGLPGSSDRPGYQRLYLTTKLDYYAEFLITDVVHTETIAADQSPFPGHEATRISIRREATIHYIWARTPQPVDEFDLDVRLGGAAGPAASPLRLGTHIGGGPLGSCETCRTQCDTCDGSCNTCPTNCNQKACQPTGTCATQCGTCNTCQTQCATQCGTCNTCGNTCPETCHPHTCESCCKHATCF